MTFREKYNVFAQGLRLSIVSSDHEFVPYLQDLEQILTDCRLMRKDISILNSKDTAKRTQEQLLQRIKQDYWKKEYLLRITNYFFMHFSEEWHGTVPRDNFITADKFYDDSELDIKLLKYLQSGEDESAKKTRPQIAEHFSISETALKEHLSRLQDGCNMLGETVKIEELRRAKNTYDSTVHPVFMALDLSDVYFLTVVVPRLAKNTMYCESAQRLAIKAHEQLSDYAKGIIDPIATNEGQNYNASISSWQQDLAWFEKSGKPCTILYGDSKQPLTGHFEMFSEENFVLDSGERMKVDYRKIIEVRKPE